ncbi:hypothetical protein K438DRAFT_1789657 [Mycena galopus ATCC 62051]|nr:hypothetical protein K438DRAFT_1789657 [Mycena galopus ATCC 62051]
MLWLPLARKTRSGAEFSAFSLPKDVVTLSSVVAALQAPDFDVAPLVAKAVASESDSQADCDSEEDDDVPDLSAPDPWNDIDDVDPMSQPSTSTGKKRPRSPTFDQVVASTKTPHTGPHCRRAPDPALKGKEAQRDKSPVAANSRCANKRLRNVQKKGHVPTAATADAHVKRAAPIATNLSTSTFPAALGAYGAKVEHKDERRGSKIPNLLGLGFQLLRWDGITPHPLLDGNGRIIAVLAGRPAGQDYLDAAAAAFCSRFPPPFVF